MSEQTRIPLLEPDIGEEERRMVDQCLLENWVSSAGPFVERFESALARRCGVSHAVSTASGTAALHLLLIAAGIGPGDKIILPDWTFAATANAVIHAGAEPVFLDVDSYWGLDCALVEDCLSQPDHGIKAIIAVDPPNGTADFSTLKAIADRHGVLLIEDAAGALGTTWDGRPAGSLAHAAIVSFNGNKIMTTGAGGAILTDDEHLAEQARHLGRQARVGADYHYDAVGYNCRMAAVNAAIGIAQLDRFDQTLSRRQEIWSRYNRELAALPGVEIQPLRLGTVGNGWMACIRLPHRDDADALVRHLEDHHITARPFWTALSNQQPYSRYTRVLTGAAAALSGTVVSLPSSTGLNHGDQTRVIDAVKVHAKAKEG
ncbi:DegT/DnrJ/EryC1/StrS family aminotransferase [Aestuariispira ectoiniformans]|uniref:DegT/DnrJ/EryC1/StrS family aminotransferase n=1 Tax=Aestuariispira ectoiniformans TaxID=2775080 RepID=UPI00223C3CA7|nr:aminotransferase class I/II-fold pyridoxal phosphate-dependent enzyme [Aestuariispira ectoiniformans]